MTYQFIFLDLDDTILDFTKSQQLAFAKICHDLGVPYSETLLQDFIHYNAALWKQLELGNLTKNALLERRFPDYFKPFGVHLDGTQTDQQFRDYLAEQVNLVDGAIDLLEQLKHSGKRIFAASNGVYDTQMKRLTNANLLHYFDDCFISEKLGTAKPNPAFFEKATATIDGFDKRHALMVGDSLTSDIKGANNFGIDVCWLNPKNLPAPSELTIQYNIQHLAQLHEII
ncbi:MAG: YjjG family noncanonical pyrimidine nucleotidase [Aerococcaceae bacterium]|nr:YjjG family noncanonical pyrimidine nucleotidase [Aerococcaceae bacterium]